MKAQLTGLTQAEVLERQQKGLVNKSTKKSSKKFVHILYDNLFTLFNILIAPMIFLLIHLNLFKEALSVGVVTLTATLIGIYQEAKAKILLDKIALIDLKKCTVIRDGERTEIPVEEIVQDDWVAISSGEPVLADGTVIEAKFMDIDESMLTGESDYIPKKEGDQLLSGSFCVSGNGIYRAEKISDKSYVNILSNETKKYKRFLSPIQRKVNYIIKFLIFFGIFLGLLMFLEYIINLHVNPAAANSKDMVRSISSIIQTLIPQGLVLSVAIIFVLSIYRMSKSGVLVQKPSAIESMAHVNVICMDKTGTLTKNELTLKKVFYFNHSENDSQEWLKAFAASSFEKNKTIEAILKNFSAFPQPFSDCIPFTSLNKYSGLRLKTNAGNKDFLLGAYENLKPFLKSSGKTAEIESLINENANDGLRVMVFLVKEAVENKKMKETLFDYEIAMILCFEDEPKPEAKEILDFFQKRDIALKIISGDHPDTVKTIADRLGLIHAHRTVTGKELEAMNELEFDQAVVDKTIFARVSPHQKREIIRTLQRKHYFTAMVGDGVNDALAIKEAQLGIAMGNGARITKDVAEIVLINNSFEIMPKVLSQGKNIIQNIKDIAKLFLFKNSYSILLILLCQFLSLTFPFIPQQVTMINFISITLPTLFILLFSKKESAMETDYIKNIAVYSISAGITTALIGLGISIYSIFLSPVGPELTRTFIVFCLISMGVFNFIYIFTSPACLKDLLNFKAILSGLAFLSLFPLAIYAFPHVRDFFNLAYLRLEHWLFLIPIALLGFILFYLISRYNLIYKIFTEKEYI